MRINASQELSRRPRSNDREHRYWIFVKMEPNTRMKIKNVTSLDEFLTFEKNDSHPMNRWIYRGVSDAQFGLRPVIGRTPPLRKRRLDTVKILNDEENLLAAFKRHAPAYSDKSPLGELD